MPDARYVGRVPLTLRTGDRLGLGLECLEDAIPLLLDDIALDSAPFLQAFRAGLNVDCRPDLSPPAKLLLAAAFFAVRFLAAVFTAVGGSAGRLPE
jgi:hypothetical protein